MHTYNTVENGYYIEDSNGNIVDPWDVVKVLNSAEALITAARYMLDALSGPDGHPLTTAAKIGAAKLKAVLTTP